MARKKAAITQSLLGYEQYIDSVLSGTRNAGLLERQAVERFNLLRSRPDIVFDADEVAYVLGIIRKFRHTSGHFYKQQFQLMPWQEFAIALKVIGFLPPLELRPAVMVVRALHAE